MSATTVRPNGKTWRGRKPIRVREFTDYDGCTGIVVLGTHDAWEATVLAAYLIAEYELWAGDAVADWWRLVPWDTCGGGFDSTWITDPERGTPCVVFQP